MVKKILLLGAGKSATVLIDYLISEAGSHNWMIIIADANKDQVVAKIKNSLFAEAVAADITNDAQRAALIREAAIVISMMPPALHFLIAKDCVELGKNLLTASYLDNSIKGLGSAIREKGLLFICEMGLDPGIDHMSAMKIIDSIKANSGVITSFKSHCGGLVAPESDNNPWHYKISWNPRNVVMAGRTGAEYKMDGEIKYIQYTSLFDNCAEVNIDGYGSLAIYPNRDSLSYLPLYQLNNAATFLRTTIRHPSFCKAWNAIVQANLASDTEIPHAAGLTFAKWSAAILPFVDTGNKELLLFLGLFDEDLVPAEAKTSAAILQYLLETRLMMQPGDKDMIIMLHEIVYEHAGTVIKIESSLVVKGEDHLRTAMAKTVGLPLGIAAKMILNGTIQVKGLHIPIIKEIYEPVLVELEKAGICFTEKYV
ncbi:MAG: saccharopine dehydrogenase C-terminal domain-containing protein [Ferruginibacter sp.]